ncbi:MAG: UDP-2,4-diacetamido-2,4,6-trideoxy-beta-L-altropyranose hydrolase [Myxococcales bacterium]|nr:UDP-2,4-diacetamido-2,4,6-trideoxy-beta-L-altropyranose hydrolase [Myxococcales bacterium]
MVPEKLMNPIKVIAVIPARGGSKGIPRKNVRFLAGRPMIHYVLDAAQQCSLIDKVVVSTDSDEISYVAGLKQVQVVKRPAYLAEDQVTLDPVIHHAVESVEQAEHCRFDIVLTLQPTSPLLTQSTLNAALTGFIAQHKVDSLISVIDDRHLCWSKQGEDFVPAYQARVNRQQLPSNYKETGAFFMTRRQWLTPTSRLGKRVSVFEVPTSEAIDIDHASDWWVAEKLLRRRRILIRVDGYNKIGLGHISRTLLLAHHLIDHELLFVSEAQHELGTQILRDSHFPLRAIDAQQSYDMILDEFKPHLVINDVLDTDQNSMQALKERGCFVVNFEDLGEGGEVVDVVINALYEDPLPRKNTFWSQAYFCLRDEFRLLEPRPVVKELKEILITFGGTDPNNFTHRVLELLLAHTQGIMITVILGRGYQEVEALESFINAQERPIRLLKDINNISHYMHRADLAFTSAGRTVYEIASLGTPLIILAQNDRELLHTFARYEHGVVNLGLGSHCSDSKLLKTLQRLLDSQELRAELQKKLLSHNLRGGVDRVIKTIFKQYEQTQP